MKVEQTSQRVSKSPGSHYVMEPTRNASAVTESEVLFGEIDSITYLLKFLTTNQTMNHAECHLQHALSITRRNAFNRNVVKLPECVLERQNPILGDSQCG